MPIRRSLRALVERADVLITDRDDALTWLRWASPASTTTSCAWHPELVVAQISALGKRGPLAGKTGSEVGAQAMAGYTRYVGTQGEPAVRLGADVAGCATAIFTDAGRPRRAATRGATSGADSGSTCRSSTPCCR